MFNPKHNLLEQQLAESGLEMTALPAAVVGTKMVFDAGMSIFGTLSANAASNRNLNFQREMMAIQSNASQEQAIATNAYFDMIEPIEQANYQQEADYLYESAVEKWNTGRQLQDYDYYNRLQQYNRNQIISGLNIGLNERAYTQAIDAERGILRDAFISTQFQRESNLSALQRTMFDAGISRAENNISLSSAQLQGQVSQLNNQLGLNQALFQADLGAQRSQLGLNQALFQADLTSQQNQQNLFRSLFEAGQQSQQNFLGLQQSLFEGQTALAQQEIRLEGIDNRQTFGQLEIQSTVKTLMERNALQKESEAAQALLAEGRGQLAQAGQSKAKGQQAVKLALLRSLRALDNELSGTYEKAGIQLAELNADSSLQRQAVATEQDRIRQMMRFAEMGYDLKEASIEAQKSFAQSAFDLSEIGLDAQRSFAQSEFDLNQIGFDAQRGFAQQAFNIEDLRISGQMDLAQQSFALNDARINGMVDFAQKDYDYNNRVLTANLNSAIEAAERNADRYALERDVANLNVFESMMLPPTRLPYAPKPTRPPEREFIPRQRLIVPDVYEYRSGADKLKDLLESQTNNFITGGRPGQYTNTPAAESTPYLDEDGNVKKGYQVSYGRGGVRIYTDKKTGQTYRD